MSTLTSTAGPGRAVTRTEAGLVSVKRRGTKEGQEIGETPLVVSAPAVEGE